MYKRLIIITDQRLREGFQSGEHGARYFEAHLRALQVIHYIVSKASPNPSQKTLDPSNKLEWLGIPGEPNNGALRHALNNCVRVEALICFDLYWRGLTTQVKMLRGKTQLALLVFTVDIFKGEGFQNVTVNRWEFTADLLQQL